MKKRLAGILIFQLMCLGAFGASYTAPSTGYLRIALSSELPAGMFVKTQGYLPGDSLKITNELNGSSTELLNLGNYSGSDALVIVTPQVASILGIQGNGIYQIKVQSRTGGADNSATGSVTVIKLVSQTKAVETVEEPQAEDEAVQSVAEEESGEETTETPLAEDSFGDEVAYNEEEYYDEENYEPSENKAGSGVTQESPSDLVAGEEDDGEEENEMDEDSPSENAVASMDESAMEEEPLQDVEEIAEEKTAGEDSEESEAFSEDPIAETPGNIEETKSESFSDELIPEEKYTEATVAEYEIYEDDYQQEAVAELPDMEEKPEEIKDDSVPIEETPVEEKPEVAEAFEEDEVPEAEEESYAPIILVPTASRAPVEEEKPVAEAKEEEPKKEEKKPAEETKTVAKKTEPAPKASAEAPKKSSSPVSPSISSHVVENESSLEKSSYYIQIAALGSEENIKRILKAYSKFPVVLVPVSGKNVYKVMIGPLNVDEYGAVLEKFKAFGFKDCFVKKIK